MYVYIKHLFLYLYLVMGFGKAGILKNSLESLAQSMIGQVAKDSTFAYLQSLGKH